MKEHNKERIKRADIGERIYRTKRGRNAMLLTAAAVFAAALLFCLILQPERARLEDIELDYPEVYVTDGERTAVDLRAESYIAQYREFSERDYAYAFWLQAEKLLAETDGYYLDEQETEAVRAEYEEYMLGERQSELTSDVNRIKYAVILVAAPLVVLALLTALVLNIMLRAALDREDEQEEPDVPDTAQPGNAREDDERDTDEQQ